jgi:5,5'-dehydrodivanillate O-demethylase
MGELLRRYWHPIAAVAELEENPIKPIRLLGEDLVLYKDESATYGLVERACPHRGADLSYGMIEREGLRCAYHGWCFDERGKCLEMPFEETVRPEGTFKDRVTIKAYSVAARAGILWAYLGPAPAPEVPVWEPLGWRNIFRQIVFAELPCNWFQCQENSIDPVHFEWLHSRFSKRSTGSGAADRAAWAERATLSRTRHVKIGFDEFEYGLIYRRILEGSDERDPLWTIGRVCLFPNGFVTRRFEWRVPVDDTTTLSVSVHMDRVPNEQEPYQQERVPFWHAPTKDPLTQRWIMTHNMNQDFAMWVGQGVIADRSRAHLAESDRGVIMLRKKMFQQADVVAAGGEPIGIIRDPGKAECVPLPCVLRDWYVNGYPRAERLAGEWKNGPPEFAEVAMQPEVVRAEWLRAMGWSS